MVMGWRIPDSQQVHPDSLVPATDHQCDAGYPVVHNSGLPISDSDECSTEVTHRESGLVVAEPDPVPDPPYVTLSGRMSKPPQQLICHPVWSQKASVLSRSHPVLIIMPGKFA